MVSEKDNPKVQSKHADLKSGKGSEITKEKLSEGTAEKPFKVKSGKHFRFTTGKTSKSPDDSEPPPSILEGSKDKHSEFSNFKMPCDKKSEVYDYEHSPNSSPSGIDLTTKVPSFKQPENKTDFDLTSADIEVSSEKEPEIEKYSEKPSNTIEEKKQL